MNPEQYSPVAPSSRVEKAPLVSIVTIVLNGNDLIRKTMDSVLCQTYTNIEYIVIDGGSADGTQQLLQEYDSRLAFWSSEADRGISDAFNKGVAKATGDIVGLLNAGDWYEPDAVEQVVEHFRLFPRTDVVCGMLQYWRGNKREYLCPSVPELLEKEMTVTHPTCFLRAELYRQSGGFSTDYRYAMDYEMLLRLRLEGTRFWALKRVLANMQHEGVSEKNWNLALKETQRARRELLPRSLYSSVCYYYFLYTKRALRRQAEKLGWEGVVRFYRQRIAVVKKTK